jgi:hypothetical protein
MTFTVAEGLHPHLARTPFYSELPFRSTLQALGRYRYGETKAAVPKPPVAFHVCRESRAFAEERYELGFPWTNLFSENEEFTEMFKKGYLDQPRVWVDFKRDEIFVVDADDVMLELGTVRGVYFGDVFTLEVLESHLEKDVGKIQNLAVAGHWSMQPPSQPRSIADGALKEGLSLTLKAFKSLKRLKLYHSDSGKSPWDGIMDESDGDDSDVGNGIWENDHFGDDLLVRRDPNELREEILKVLGEQKVLRKLDSGFARGRDLEGVAVFLAVW